MTKDVREIVVISAAKISNPRRINEPLPKGFIRHFFELKPPIGANLIVIQMCTVLQYRMNVDVLQ